MQLRNPSTSSQYFKSYSDSLEIIEGEQVTTLDGVVLHRLFQYLEFPYSDFYYSQVPADPDDERFDQGFYYSRISFAKKHVFTSTLESQFKEWQYLVEKVQINSVLAPRVKDTLRWQKTATPRIGSNVSDTELLLPRRFSVTFNLGDTLAYSIRSNLPINRITANNVDVPISGIATARQITVEIVTYASTINLDVGFIEMDLIGESVQNSNLDSLERISFTTLLHPNAPTSLFPPQVVGLPPYPFDESQFTNNNPMFYYQSDPNASSPSVGNIEVITL